MSSLLRTIDRLVEMDPDDISDDDLPRYLEAVRETLRWARREIVAAREPRTGAQVVQMRPRAVGRPTEWTGERIRDAMLAVEHAGTVRDAAATLRVNESTLREQLKNHAPAEWWDRVVIRARLIRGQRASETRVRAREV